MPTVANLSGFFYLAIEYITLLDTYMYSWFLNKRSFPPWLIFFHSKCFRSPKVHMLRNYFFRKAHVKESRYVRKMLTEMYKQYFIFEQCR